MILLLSLSEGESYPYFLSKLYGKAFVWQQFSHSEFS